MPEGASTTHRERLLAGMTAAVAERGGLAGTTVADVVRHARTSRRTFYEHFQDRDACYLALFESTMDRQIAAVAAAVRPGDLDDQLERLVGVWLSEAEHAPALSASFVRDLPALGRRGAERQQAVVNRFARLVVDVSGHADDRSELDYDLAVAVVAGMRELVVTAVEQRRDVRELAPVAVRLLRAVSALP